MKIGVDMLGGDHAPKSTVEGAILARQERPEVGLVLLGDESTLRSELESQGQNPDDFEIVHWFHLKTFTERSTISSEACSIPTTVSVRNSHRE